MDVGSEPFLETDGIQVDRRDVRALRAIDEQGSLSGAAASLGRSYARLQQRVTELEAALGPLVERRRGGKDGGGSKLTENASSLLARFERLDAECEGLARATESTFRGTVIERSGNLGTVGTPVGPLRAVVTADSRAVQVTVRSDAVQLVVPDAVPEAASTSVRNHVEGVVAEVESSGGLVRVALDIPAEAPLYALITESSRSRLCLDPGRPIVASFKATATRAVNRPDRSG